MRLFRVAQHHVILLKGQQVVAVKSSPTVVEETDPNENDETNEINESRQGEPGLGSGDGRWIQPPRND